MFRGAWRCTFIVIVGATTWAPGTAQAQTDNRAAARSAAEAGADAYDQGQYARALELFGRAEQLVHAPPHLLFMARSLAKLGHVVEARETYLRIINEQLTASAPKAFESAHAQAESEVTAVDARVAYVTVTIRGSNATDATLSIDRTDVPAAELGIPVPMDPGTHVFSAYVGQTRSNEETVTLRDGAKESIELTLPEPSVKATASPAPASVAHGSSGAKRVVAYSALGVGAVGVVVGTYFLVDTLKWLHLADDVYECNATRSCTPENQALVAHYDHEANLPRTWTIVSTQ